MSEAWKQWEGQVIHGNFRLTQYLGGSDRSAVFLTERGGGLPEKAAIKLIAAEPQDAELRLARWGLAAQLAHPNLIRIFEMGRCQLGEREMLYVVMEYAEENLAQILPERPLTAVETRQMLEAVLGVLGFLHGKGLVQGRLKPASIMATGDQLKISSDDLCKAGELNRSMDGPGVYDAPESQTTGKSPAGDMWSLGMTLAEVLSQHLPVWDRAQQGEPILPETLPAPFGDIARNCLRRDPQSRWTVADVVKRLQPATPPVPAAPPRRPAVASLRKPSPKRSYLIPAAGIVFALAMFYLGTKLFSRPSETERASAPALAEPKVSRKPEPRPATDAAAQSTKKNSEAPPASTGTPAPPAAIQTEVQEQKPVRHRVPGKIVQQAMPDISEKARGTIQGRLRVSVRVHVDPSGNVVGAELESPGPSTYFAGKSLQAAKRWEFEAPEVDGRKVASEWVLRFVFTSTETKVVPAQAVP
ncbi:MAG: TonB family protein [Acidobacteriia bacterium]|nr:TonB family protein [Terriglobia bacterium]